MRAAIGSQCKLIKRGVMCVLFSSLKINLAAAFWINCRGLIELAGRPTKRALFCVRKAETWLKRTRSSVFAMKGRETGL